MNRFIQPLSEEFLYGSPETMGRACYRFVAKPVAVTERTIQSKQGERRHHVKYKTR